MVRDGTEWSFAAPRESDSRFRFLDVRRWELHTLSRVSLATLLDECETAERWVVDGIIPSGGLTLVSAGPKVGKSTALRCLALAVARGDAWLGRRTTQGRVLYVCLEDKRSEVRLHYAEMGAAGTEPIEFIFDRTPPRGAMDRLVHHVHELDPRLVVIDSLFRFLRVRDVSNYAAVIHAFDPLIDLARGIEAALVLTHHQRKGGGTDGDEILGSQAIFGSIDNAVLLSRRGTQRTIRTQVRIGEDMPPTTLVLDEKGYVSLGDAHRECRAQRIDDDIARCLADSGVSMTIEAVRRAVRRAVGRRAEDVNEALARLTEAGCVARTGRGRKADPYQFRFLTPSDGESNSG